MRKKNYERRAVKRKAQPAINTFENEKKEAALKIKDHPIKRWISDQIIIELRNVSDDRWLS